MKINKDILHSVVEGFVKKELAFCFAESSRMVIGELEKGGHRYQLQVTLTRSEYDLEDELDSPNVFH